MTIIRYKGSWGYMLVLRNEKNTKIINKLVKINKNDIQ